MSNAGFRFFGCLALTLIFCTLFIFKFWFIIFLVVITLILLRKLSIFAGESQKSNPEEFTTRPGVIYKECSFCHNKANRHDLSCNNCGKSFEEELL